MLVATSDLVRTVVLAAPFVLFPCLVLYLGYLYRHRLVPDVIQAWADELGYKVLQRERARSREALSYAIAERVRYSRCEIFRVVVLDEAGRSREGILSVQPRDVYVIPFRAADCRVVVRWKDPKPTSTGLGASNVEERVWDREIDTP